MVSMTINIACWMIFSLGEAIPSGRSWPLGLGMYTRRLGEKGNFSERSAREVDSNHLFEIPSSVTLVVPLTMLPGLDLMVSYASLSTTSEDSVSNTLQNLPLESLRRSESIISAGVGCFLLRREVVSGGDSHME